MLLTENEILRIRHVMDITGGCTGMTYLVLQQNALTVNRTALVMDVPVMIQLVILFGTFMLERSGAGDPMEYVL